uniref:ATPase phospholipid transporting 8B2 n=1 Tax=Hucho hucho TaxID=62062 RepID=A0A4W5MCT9_9TELE
MVCEFIYSVCVLCLCRETNMKVRQSLSVTAELGDPNNLASFDGEVVCEPPNNKLDRFCGLLCWRDCKYPLSNHNMLLRGCVLRNTETCYGLVIFAGPDTKLMQNSGRTKFKRTSIDRLMNTLVLWVGDPTPPLLFGHTCLTCPSNIKQDYKWPSGFSRNCTFLV